jgi:glutaredoxin
VAEAKTFTEADAKAALSEVRIEMYATSWCGSCRRAREYMDFNAISYTEYDIDSDPEAKARLSMINPRKSIPTFQIDDIVQVGFSAENFEHRLNEAVRVRLHR